MSLGDLHAAVAAMPAVDRGIAEVRALARAAGGRRRPAETRMLRDLLVTRGTTFQPRARLALATLAGLDPRAVARDVHWTGRLPTDTFTIVGEYPTPDIEEPSGVAVLPGRHGLLVVDDEVGLRRAPLPDGRLTTMASDDVLVDGRRWRVRNAEGIAHDAARRSILVLVEGGTVYELRIARARPPLRLSQPTKLGRLPEAGRGRGAGWEGLCVLPAARAPDRRTHLLAVHERKPRRLGVFTRSTLALEAALDLPPALADGLRDLSDVTVDPVTGRVLLLSDESCALFACDLRRRHGRWRLDFVVRTPLPERERGGRLQPEGLDFDRRGNLWIACDQGRCLLFARRSRYRGGTRRSG